MAQLRRSLGSLWWGSDCDSWDGPKGAAPSCGDLSDPQPDLSGAKWWQGQGDHGGMVQW